VVVLPIVLVVVVTFPVVLLGRRIQQQPRLSLRADRVTWWEDRYSESQFGRMEGLKYATSHPFSIPSWWSFSGA